ncbi:MAG TPA: 3-hydroxybutyrate dehydrogenase [Clostridiaceae bacterium]|nr:3-hydroxybutyrate dehydrogenase [Clostridiaceae bacterium]
MSKRTAIVTGSASGIGKGVITRLAKEGFNAVVTDINMEGAEAVAEELRAAGGEAMAIELDVTDEASVIAGFDKIVEKYGSIDVVHINAGIQIVHEFDKYPFEDWKKLMAVQADGAFLCAREAFRKMKDSGKGGHIIFTGSTHSYIGSPMKQPYSFAKHGYIGMSKAIAKEGAKYKIYTYTICPTFVRTPFIDRQLVEISEATGASPEEVIRDQWLGDTVDGEFTKIEEIANAIVYLANDTGALTGQSLMLSHGMHMM